MGREVSERSGGRGERNGDAERDERERERRKKRERSEANCTGGKEGSYKGSDVVRLKYAPL